MYKLIIIDDEITASVQLADFIDYSKYNFSVSAVFQDPQKALAYIAENHVDLIITDIKMTAMSGIEVLKTVNEQFPYIIVILVSAYRDFSYAKQAITYNAFEYINKPILFSDYTNALIKAAEELDNLNRTFALNEDTSLQLQQGLCDYLNNVSSETELVSILSDIMPRIDINHCNCSVIEISIPEIDNYLSKTWSYGHDRLSYAIVQILSTQICDIFFSLLSFSANTLKFIAMDMKKDSEYEKRLSDLIASVKHRLHSLLKINVDISVSSTSDSLSGLRQNAPKSVSYQVRSIIKCIVDGNYTDAEGILKEFFSSDSISEQHDFCIKLSEAIHSIDAEYKHDFLDEIGIHCINNPQTLYDYCETIVDSYKNYAADSESTDLKKNIILKAMLYTNAHFSDDISLEVISKYVMLNPSYFSYYFKKETGDSFSDYLLSVRMEHAKKMLQEDPDIKISTLATLLGYKSQSYFYKTFQKFTGLSPAEYKKSKK